MVYFFTGSAPIGSLAYDIASTRFSEHDWHKFVLDTEEKQVEFETVEHRPDLIISFLNPYIVPARYLETVAGRAYNVHPSPPTYPGNDPQHFAIYDGHHVAGATLHVMDPRVDSGVICAVIEEPLDPIAGLGRLRELSTHLSLSILLEHLPRLLDGTIAPNGRTWTADNKHGRADFLAMCRIDPDISASELRRRLEAFYLPTHLNRPFVEIHGARFVYDPDRRESSA